MAPPPDILRQKALTAAASVVLAFGSGCLEGKVEGNTQFGEEDDTGEDPGDGGSGGDGGAGGDEGAGTGGDEGAGTGGDEGAGTGGDDGPPDCTEAEDMAACCEDLTEWCNDTHGADTEDAIECIYGPDFDGSTGCIPWGPPVPPAMA
jgi:hypothetical protein